MNHKKFNQILWSVVGGAVLCVVVLILVTLVRLDLWGGGTERARIPAVQGAGDGDEGPGESVALCLPTVVRGTTTRWIGVSIVDRSLPESKNVIGSGSSGWVHFSADCQLLEDRSLFDGRIQNALAWDPVSGEQRLLFPGRVLLGRFEAPGEECDEDAEPDRGRTPPMVPCDGLYWEVREEDTNGDGAIDSHDARVPYISDLDGSDLRRMTPAGTHLVSIDWDPDLGYFLQAATDADGDGVFGPRDPVELLRFDPATDRVPRQVASPEALAAAEALLN